jgi:predicted metal-dependent phosphotriesterase family hydrolase
MPPIVMTVIGAIDPGELGITLAHEHLLLDLTCVWHPPHEPWQQPLVDARPTLANCCAC